MSDVFISYSRRNADFLEKIYSRLKEGGVESWVDWESIKTGDSWRQEIFDGIESATKFICILSEHWWKSEICQAELKHARKFNKIIIPVIRQSLELADVGGHWLNKSWEQDARDNWEIIKETNWQNFREEDDFDAALRDLVEVLRENQAYASYHANLTTQARRWEGDKLNADLLLRGKLLAEAEQWLADHAGEPNPPTELHRVYVAASREVEDEREAQQRAMETRIAESHAEADRLQAEQEKLRQRIKVTRRASIVLGVLVAAAVIASVIALGAQQQAEIALADADRRLYAAEQVSEGLWNVSQQDYETAILYYTDAIEAAPDYVVVYVDRGNAYAALEEYGKAITDFSQAIELAPEYDVAYINRGDAYATLEEYGKAITDFSRAIELDPEYDVAYINRGNAYGALEEYEKAITDFSRAIELDPEFDVAYINRGNAYGALEEYEKAITDFSQAIELDPEYAWGYYYRAVTNVESSSPDCAFAASDIEQVETLAPDDPDLPELREDYDKVCGA